MLAICSSISAEGAPATPIDPTVFPSTTRGTPPPKLTILSISFNLGTSFIIPDTTDVGASNVNAVNAFFSVTAKIVFRSDIIRGVNYFFLQTIAPSL